MSIERLITPEDVSDPIMILIVSQGVHFLHRERALVEKNFSDTRQVGGVGLAINVVQIVVVHGKSVSLTLMPELV